MCLRLLSLIPLSNLINHQYCCDFCFWLLTWYVPGMFQVASDFYRAPFSPCPARLLLSVRVLILKEYENLHVHFEDCVGRRVTNASGAFSDPFHIDMQQYLYLTLSSFSCTSSLRLEYRILLDWLHKNTYIPGIKLLASCLNSILYHTIANILCICTQACDRRPSRPPA